MAVAGSAAAPTDQGTILRTRRSGRRWRRALVPVAATVALGGCWLQPGADGHRSGHNPLESRLTRANVATLTEAWSVTVGPDAVRAPVVSGVGVHAVSRDTLATYRLGDGEQRWSVDVIPFEGVYGEAAPPRVWRDELLVPIFINFRQASFTASFDARTGEGGERAAPYALGSLDGDVLVGTEERIVGTDIILHYLHSTNLADPTQSWEALYPGGNLESAVSDAWIISVGPDSTVHAFPRSGPSEELCQPLGGTEIGCRPAWSRAMGLASVPAISDDGRTVYVGDAAAGTLSALDIATGEVRWSGDIGVGPQPPAAPTVGDGSVFATSSDGRLTAFDADGCGSAACPAQWSTAATGSPVRTQAALAGGVVYVGSDDGMIRAFDAAGCGADPCPPLWETDVGSAVTGAPAVARGHLVVGTADGRLLAFQPS